MLRKLRPLLLAFAFPATASSQQTPGTTPSDQVQLGSANDDEKSFLEKMDEKVDVNFLLRGSLEVPDGGRDNQAGVRLNEARMEVLGKLTPQLSYRVRYRLNRSMAPTTQDNASGSLDWAAATYAFGQDRQWKLTVGKQAAMVGNWEFEKNPTFEYQYSELVNRQLNIFLTAIKLAYDIDEDHTVLLQLHNTHNSDFRSTVATAGYDASGIRPAKLPAGLYAAWLGKFWEKKFQTFYSYNISQFADEHWNHSVNIGNKVVLDRFQAYFDLSWSNVGLEYFNIASPSVNAFRRSAQPGYVPVFAQNLNYKNAVLRLDYEFVPGWFITTKGIWEGASDRAGGSILGSNFRRHIGLLGGLEYQPVKDQDMKLFAYYYNNKVRYDGAVETANTNSSLSLVGVGLLYFLNAF